MRTTQFHRISGMAMMGFSVAALLTILSAFRVSLAPFSIYTQPPQADEGAQAHLFQLFVLMLAPATLLFLLTWDRRQRPANARPVVVSFVAAALAFGILYYFEHR